MRATGKPKERKAKNSRARTPPPGAVFHVAIRSLVEFVFPFSPLSKSQRRQLAETSALYTFLEEIWQSFFALPSLQNLKMNPGRNSIRAWQTHSIPDVPSSPACHCAAGILHNRNNMDGVLRFVPVWRIGRNADKSSRQGGLSKNLDFMV